MCCNSLKRGSLDHVYRDSYFKLFSLIQTFSPAFPKQTDLKEQVDWFIIKPLKA